MNKSNQRKYNKRIKKNKLEIGIACLTGKREEVYQSNLKNAVDRYVAYKMINIIMDLEKFENLADAARLCAMKRRFKKW